VISIRRTLTLLGTFALAATLLGADVKLPPADQPYKVDLSKLAAGAKPPEELYIVNGAFTIADDAGKRVLELAGNPVDSFCLLFGPDEQTATEVSARISGTNEGKMFPEFGVGANDSAGWKVWLMPGQKALVLRKNMDEKARIPFTWTSGKYTSFRLRVAKAADDKWEIKGKAWPADGKEPAEWMISATDTAAPSAGRAVVCGHPYSGTPIRFDEMTVNPVK
jgi:hypothetical protein